MRVLVFGVVQGVGFRPCVYNIARSMDLAGYVRNNGSNVEIVLDRDHDTFVERLKRELPPLARIERIELESSDDVDMNDYRDFTILFSKSGSRASVIPADTALCDNCTNELFSRGDRRHLYPFINCTDCGARYSLIADLPYDRDKTSMAGFKMCSYCQGEYIDPGNRRFHAQTTACPLCGPKYILHDGEGEVIEREQEGCFREFARRLDLGEVGVMKSWGGMHIISNFRSIGRMRKLYGRPQKPFAIMMRDLDAVKRIAHLTDLEERLLTSHQRPIVLVKKKDEFPSYMDGISPGLDTVGIMLPYSPSHLLLFRYFREDGVIATSGNLPGEPICMDNEDAFSLKLDSYLLHDRGIIQRVDDTVVRALDDNRFFIRKSRGFVPDPINVDYDATILAIGAEENVVSAVSRKGKIFLSQYIGNTKHYDTLMFLEKATDHMLELLGVDDADMVARDLHPMYATRAVGEEYGKRFGCDILDVQHHWAHAASLALDNGVEETMVTLALDGSGYGPDGTIWGGEILESDFEQYRRIGHLQQIPLLGGEKAIRDVRRLVFAISEMSGGEPDLGYFGENEKDIFRKMLPGSIMTSSSGRVLDAITTYLDICHYRSYDGEPAMKLEKYLAQGRRKYEFEATTLAGECSVVETLPLFEQMFSLGPPKDMGFREKCDIAHSLVSAIIGEMTRVACEHASSKGIRYVGATGGVSYNEPIIRMIQGQMERYPELELVLHDRLPSGDGGISAGQNVIAGTRSGL